jgi:hypothetical protein
MGESPATGSQAADDVHTSIPVLEIYKLAVEMVDRISARRGTANAFFLSTQTALVTVVGLGTPNLRHIPWWTSGVIALAGISLSLAWWVQLRRYRAISQAKFDVIIRMESLLPLSPYRDEQIALESSRPNRWGANELGAVERRIPWIFAVLHILVLIGRVIT